MTNQTTCHDEACLNCGKTWDDPSEDTSYYGGICDSCFEAMPMGEWVASWEVEA